MATASPASPATAAPAVPTAACCTQAAWPVCVRRLYPPAIAATWTPLPSPARAQRLQRRGHHRRVASRRSARLSSLTVSGLSVANSRLSSTLSSCSRGTRPWLLVLLASASCRRCLLQRWPSRIRRPLLGRPARRRQPRRPPLLASVRRLVATRALDVGSSSVAVGRRRRPPRGRPASGLVQLRGLRRVGSSFALLQLRSCRPHRADLVRRAEVNAPARDVQRGSLALGDVKDLRLRIHATRGSPAAWPAPGWPAA